MYQRIAVAVAGPASEFQTPAIDYAAWLARNLRADLELVHVHPPTRLDDPLEAITPYQFERVLGADRANDDRVEAAERIELAQIAARVASRAGVGVRANVLDGPVAPLLERYAARAAVDLLVLGPTLPDHTPDGPHGDIWRALVHRSPIPVLFAGEPSEPGASLGPRLRRILVALDGSELSEQILEPVAALARAFDAGARLLRVLPPKRRRRDGSADDPAGAEAYLRGIAGGLERAGIAASYEVVQHTDPAAAISEVADSRDVDLIAMATHGWGGLRRVLLGSVTESVLDIRAGGPLPLLVSRPRRPAPAATRVPIGAGHDAR